MFTSALKRSLPPPPPLVDLPPRVDPPPPPKRIECDVILGQEAAKASLRNWNRTKPLLLCGPTGVGKTTLARWALQDYKIWCEDDSPSEAVLTLSSRKSLVSQKWAVLVECAEALNEERAKLVDALKTAKIPVIVTCDFPLDKSLLDFRKKFAEIIYLRPLDWSTCIRAMKAEAARSGFPMSEDSCDKILEAAGSNIRQAINSMHFLVQTKNREKGHETVIGSVDKTTDMFSEASKICSGQLIDPLTDSDMILLMMHENLPLSSASLSKMATSMEALSEVDCVGFEKAMTMEAAIRATAFGCSGPQATPRMQYPSYLGKMSSMSSKIPKIRRAAGFVLPTIGPEQHAQCGPDMTDTSRIFALERKTRLNEIYPSGIEAVERLQTQTARVFAVEGSKKNAKALQKAKLWIEGDDMEIVRSGVFK